MDLLGRLVLACKPLNFSGPLNIHTLFGHTHEINSHEINSHEINSHQINFPRDQLPRGQLAPDQLLIKVVMKCDSVWVNVGSRSVPLQWSVPLQKIFYLRVMHHFKHYSVINHCHISIIKVELVVVDVGRHSGLKTIVEKSYPRDHWCDVKGASYHGDETRPVWKPTLCSLLEKGDMCREKIKHAVWEISEWGVQQLKIKLDLETIYLCVPFNIINLVFCYICIFKNYTELISWELTSWEVDLVGIDLVGVDLVREWFRGSWSRGRTPMLDRCQQ